MKLFTLKGICLVFSFVLFDICANVREMTLSL